MGKEKLLISTLVSIFGKDVKDVAIIGTNTYCLACQLKRAQVFTISIKNLEFQAEKKARPETNPKTFLPEEYYDFLNMFLKKNSDKLPFYQKYDYKIILEEE